MGLYGLDIIVRNNKFFLNEINGHNSGMKGFEEIYGDNRVEDKVFNILEKKYGKLTINTGRYDYLEDKKKNPISTFILDLIIRVPFIRNYIMNKVQRNQLLKSQKADINWLDDKTPNATVRKKTLEIYVGQESGVFNFVNTKIPHTSINPIVSQAISENKFLQYLVLKNSSIADGIIDSCLVGLGATNNDELSKLLDTCDNFVVKPIIGSCGKGVKFLTKDEVYNKYMHTGGSVDYVTPFQRLFSLMGESDIIYFEDLVDNNNFDFEYGVSIVQPFIDSKEDNNYSVIRAIVCEDEFIDAYKRESNNPKVNLSQDAKAVPFEYDSNFISYCNLVIKTFKAATQKLDIKNFKKSLYTQHIEEIGRIPKNQRNIRDIGIDRFLNTFDKF